MKWTKIALTAMMMATLGLCFTACDEPPPIETDSDGEFDEELTERALSGNAVFELDGNAQTGSLTDWQTLIPNGVPTTTANFPVVTFQADSAAADNIFTGGGSKDPEPISSWRHKVGKASPDKDNLLNAYAAAHFNALGELIVVFGADRFANSGDAQIGFWFFQDEITLNNNGTFSGAHEDGDVLVLANFSNGGSTVTIEVLEWRNGGLQVLTEGNFVCTAGGTTNACAISNGASATTQSYWAYNGKGQTVDNTAPYNNFLPFSFFEGGVNITKLFPNTPPCFASFLAETRASTSESATLKDFVLDSFQECEAEISVTANCTTAVEAEDDRVSVVVNYSGSVCNNSSGPALATLQNVFVTGPDGAKINVANVPPNECRSYSGSFDPDTASGLPNPSSTSFSGTVTATGTPSTGGSAITTDPVNFSCPLCP